jgi:hypothetical protein
VAQGVDRPIEILFVQNLERKRLNRGRGTGSDAMMCNHSAGVRLCFSEYRQTWTVDEDTRAHDN